MRAPTRHPPQGVPRFSLDEHRREPARPTAPRRLASENMLAGNTEIEIEHGDAVYRLRVTSLGKLILTK
jgi:hemin uptake protein HemP